MTITSTRPGTGQSPPALGWLDRRFRISERGSTVATEVRGGFSTFFTMAYIVVLNPLILAGAADMNGQQLDIGEVTTVTALVAAVMTLAMGLFGNMPLAIAAGLGLNGVVAFQLAPQMTWEGAMGIVVLEGLVVTVLVLTGFREKVFHAVPDSLKYGIAAGIGLFIAFIGFVDAGFIRRNPDAAGTPVPVGLGTGGRLLGWPTVVFIVGLVITGILVVRRVRGAVFLGILVTTVFAHILNAIVDVPPQFSEAGYNPQGWGLTVPKLPDDLTVAPDFSLVGNFSIADAFEVGVIAAILFIFTLFLADFFDTVGTVVGVGSEGDLLNEDGAPENLREILLVDSLAAVVGGAASASSNTAYIESAAGVGDGARTGLASVVTALLFGVALFATPLVSVIPYEAATPALVIVGFMMFLQLRKVMFDDWELALPAFLTVALMPLTYSITNGIGAGLVLYAVLRIVNGKARETHWLIFATMAAFVVYFAIDPVEQLLGVK